MTNPLLLPEIREMLAENKIGEIREFCTTLHPVNVADFLSGLTPNEIWAVLGNLDSLDRIDIFRNFDRDLQLRLVETVPQKDFIYQINSALDDADIKLSAQDQLVRDELGAAQKKFFQLNREYAAIKKKYLVPLEKSYIAPAVDSCRRRARSVSEYVIEFAKWTVISIFMGIICGFLGAAFQFCLREANQIFSAHFHLMIFLLPLGGLIIVFFYRLVSLPVTIGTNEVIDSLTAPKKPSLWLGPMIFLGTVVTHFFGGSAGREGAALQLGGCVGIGTGRLLRLDYDDQHIAILCGMSSCFAAIFGTPLTATVFALEMAHVGLIFYPALVPCIFASLVSYKIAAALGVQALNFNLGIAQILSILYVAKIVGLAILCALVCIFFCSIMRRTRRTFAERVKNDYLRIVIGALLVIGLTWMIGTPQYNGVGITGILNALAGKATGSEFFWKALFTAITLGVGFKGGEIVPAFFIGATFGCVVGPLLGLPAPLSAALGLVGVFCGTVNCPLTSFVLSIELFGSDHLLLFAIVCGITYALSGYYSLYGTQRIVYSKIHADLIDIQAK